MLSKIIFITFALANASVLWIPGKIDRLDDDSVAECVDHGTRCNPFLETPCCEDDNTCEFVGFSQYQNIHVCLKLKQSKQNCQNNADCFKFNNAKCNSNNKCQCLLNYEAVNGTKCMPRLGGECFNNSDCIVGNSICVDRQCVCKSTFIPKSNDQCTKSQLGNLCHDDYDCNDISHARCSENHVCTCRPHHVVENSATCESLLGGYCQRTRECAPSSSVCIDHKCQCNNGYLFITPEKCGLTPLGKTCHDDLDCQIIPFATCSSEKQCICKSGYVEVNNTTCAPLLGSFCLSDEPCAVDNSLCIDNKCQCMSSYRTDDDKSCVIGKSCYSHSDCGDFRYSECSTTKICVCRRNHVRARDLKCLPLLSELCYPGDSCAPDHSICIHNECQCKLGYKFISNNQCIPAQLGLPCTVNDDCRAINAICSEYQICQCRANSTFLHTSKCAPILGGFCDENNLCAVANSACVNEQCRCKKDFTRVLNNQCLSLWD